MADTFDHAPAVWTARQLRSALADVPDDAPISIGVAGTPGDFDEYDEFVLVGAEPVEVDPGDGEDPGTPQVEFTLFADAKAGLYYLDME
ncbi:DUF6225 family protein [Streptomyces sp. NPDC004126]|uniref:DUF6225 family protein n=1 Tax=Streptomyces TaxID=1883 RepID=UPI000F79503C|nr:MULTISPECIES: DUF6225 family protein [Streptomyces]RST01810.1 hypothetical protein EF910_26065 [Streptomyces sp. WAC07149]GLX23566.1 hypothetical protein Slala01_72100 [Streptomyces lavendulae subsp. lavendulae]GLX31386.1 hypothetical protein Slala02_72050 [Streptomyces lavendulae subsp. lavendulae]